VPSEAAFQVLPFLRAVKAHLTMPEIGLLRRRGAAFGVAEQDELVGDGGKLRYLPNVSEGAAQRGQCGKAFEQRLAPLEAGITVAGFLVAGAAQVGQHGGVAFAIPREAKHL
jgi:hypothetical protein